MQESLRSDFAPAQLARQVLRAIAIGGCLASAGVIALLFYEGGIKQANHVPRQILLIGGKPGQPNSLLTEGRKLNAIGARVVNENQDFLGCVGPDAMNISEDFCE